MIFNEEMKADGSYGDDIDALVKDPDTIEGVDAIADEINSVMGENALSSLTYFAGGEEAIKHFAESADLKVLVESRRMPKKSFTRLSKNDDLLRRERLATLILAREAKDPLFFKLAKNRVQERKLRAAIFKKYGNKASRIAKRSQMKHMKTMRKLPSLPKITF